MYLLELNADTWNTKKMIKRPNFIFCSKWPWPTNLVFYIISSFLSSCTKWSYLQQSIHQGRKKQGHCVQGDYKHFGNQTHSPSGVFCLGVYYTRDNTDKDCYIRQGRSQYGAFRTSTMPASLLLPISLLVPGVFCVSNVLTICWRPSPYHCRRFCCPWRPCRYLHSRSLCCC